MAPRKPRGRPRGTAEPVPVVEPVPTKAQVTDIDQVINQFEQSDLKYREEERRFLSGEYLFDITVDNNIDATKENHIKFVENLKTLLEDRNVKRRNVIDRLRASVSLESSKVRGIDGKPTINKVGAFWVSSVTKRSLHPGDLQRKCMEIPGLWETLISETSKDKDGNDYNIVRPTLEIDYEKVSLWLRANGFEEILQVAYDEKETTPMVKGPKALSFMGDERKD